MSKKCYWNWGTDDFMDEDINQYIEVCKKKNNSWWKSLKNVNSVYTTHKDIFKEWASNIFVTNQFNEISMTTAKTCPAIGNGLLDKIILVKSPCDVLISINEQGNIAWNSKNPNQIQIDVHGPDQFHTEKHNPFENKINIKFVLPIIFSSSKQTYMFLQPQFHKQNYPFEVVNGSVNTDRIRMAVNTLIEIPNEQKEYYLKAGTILSYIWLDNNNIILEKNIKLKHNPAKRFFGNHND